MRYAELGQAAIEVRFTLECVIALLALAQMMAETGVDQPPPGARLDEQDMSSQRNGIIVSGRVDFQPARAWNGAKQAATVETEATAIQPEDTQAPQVQVVKTHA
ncbi:MAG: hypothetical protein NVSMB2_11350 [Chloroflexota bacterium]